MPEVRYANAQQIHCPVCAVPLWTEAYLDSHGWINRRLTETSAAHMAGHAEGTGCTCTETEHDEFVAFDGPCTRHHGYHCLHCIALGVSGDHTHVYVRKWN